MARGVYALAALVSSVLFALVALGCGDGGRAEEAPVSLDPSAAEKRRLDIQARTRRLERALARRERASQHGAAGGDAPRVTKSFIPFPEQRKQEMAEYSQRHYGMRSYRLVDPRVIVQHYTASADAQSAINLFAQDVPDSELHELPGTCAHYVIDRDGTIHQLVPLSLMCRHTVGLNYTSIGIEHAGFSDQQVLSNAAQLRASLNLTRWLRCRFGIEVENVIGHNENTSSPLHRERVARWKTQTHGDFARQSMDVYRSKLRALEC